MDRLERGKRDREKEGEGNQDKRGRQIETEKIEEGEVEHVCEMKESIKRERYSMC